MARLYGAPPGRARFPRLHGKPAAVAQRERLLVFFHGGDPATHDGRLRRLAEVDPGLLIMAPDCSLAQARSAPVFADGAYAILRWAGRRRLRIGWSGAHLLVAGVEADASLAKVADMIFRDRANPFIAGDIQWLTEDDLFRQISLANFRVLV